MHKDSPPSSSLNGPENPGTDKSHRNPHETFTWLAQTWDIAKLWRQIDSEKITSKAGHFEEVTLDRAFIESYAKQVLALKAGDAPGKQTMSLFMRMDGDRARGLPADALYEPVIFLHMGKKGGPMIQMGEDKEPKHMLGDGNHRLAKAFYEGVQSLQAFVMTEATSRQFLLNSPALNRAVRVREKLRDDDRPRKKAASRAAA